MIRTKPTISLPTTHSADSRVWVYPSNRPFNTVEVEQLNQVLGRFAEQWVSHNRQLKASGFVLFDQFIVLMVDESQAGASGCSIDSSVHFIRAIGEQLKIDFFDRMTFAIWQDDQVKTFPKAAFKVAYEEGKIDDETLVFNPLVNTKAELENGFICTLKDSWHKRFVS